MKFYREKSADLFYLALLFFTEKSYMLKNKERTKACRFHEHGGDSQNYVYILKL